MRLISTGVDDGVPYSIHDREDDRFTQQNQQVSVYPEAGVAFFTSKVVFFHLEELAGLNGALGEETIDEKLPGRSMFFLASAAAPFSDEFLVQVCHGVMDWARHPDTVVPSTRAALFVAAPEGNEAASRLEALTARKCFSPLECLLALGATGTTRLSDNLITDLVAARAGLFPFGRKAVSFEHALTMLLSPVPSLRVQYRTKHITDPVWWYLYRTAEVFATVLAARTNQPSQPRTDWRRLADGEADSGYGPMSITQVNANPDLTDYEVFGRVAGTGDPAMMALSGLMSSEPQRRTLSNLLSSLANARAMNTDIFSSSAVTDIESIVSRYPDVTSPVFVSTPVGEFIPLSVGFFSVLEDELMALDSLNAFEPDAQFCGGGFDGTSVEGRASEQELRKSVPGDSLRVFDVVSEVGFSHIVLGVKNGLRGKALSEWRVAQAAEASHVEVTFAPAVGGDYHALISADMKNYIFNQWRQRVIETLETYYADPATYETMPLTWYLALNTMVLPAPNEAD